MTCESGHDCTCGGCAPGACDCCGGVQRLTPRPVHNRPGLGALDYRVGTHAGFYASMQARLATMEVDGLAADGQTPLRLRPLGGLTTRAADDFSLGLLDAWASVGDVLSFYQERIANEGYLGTATERRSVLELARLVGYRLRPGVAASAYLAYTVDDNQADPVSVPAGARSQSIPGPDEQPQFFETSEELVARREWNDLRARRLMPQYIDGYTVMLLDELHLSGVNSGLRPGDKLLYIFSEDGSDAAVRTVDGVDTQFEDSRSLVRLKPLAAKLRACLVLLLEFIAKVTALLAATGGRSGVLARSEEILAAVRLGTQMAPQHWAPNIGDGEGEDPAPEIQKLLTELETGIAAVLQGGSRSVPATSPEAFVGALLVERKTQPRNSLSLRRSLAESFATPQAQQTLKLMAAGNGDTSRGFSEYADPGTQLLLNFAPLLREGYYAAWSGATLNERPPPLRNVYALRARMALFGATAGKLARYYDGTEKAPDADADAKAFPAGTLKPQDEWGEWRYAGDERGDNAFLEHANDNLAVDGYVLLHTGGDCRVLRITALATAPRTAYGLSGPSTRLDLSTPDGQDWRRVSNGQGEPDTIEALRTTQFYLQSEALPLAQRPIADDVAGREIQLDGLYKELRSGRWVVVSGERTDIAEVAGVRTAELMMITAVRHGYDPNLPGDTAHTTLSFKTGLAYRYRRASVAVHGNVVQATHGATVEEVLGSGDGAQALQRFTLKQPPLTFVAAPTAAGAASTLQVRVNEVTWHEADSLSELAAAARSFVCDTDDAGAVTLTFGDGVNGQRLPSGVQNLKARYRSGIGAAGNVRAGQISQLQTRPQGIKGVVNPLRASGGGGRESRDLARENAPLSVLALERLVSVSDYADFSRRFAGIAKASAVQASDGARQLVHVSIAGVDDAPIDNDSDLYRNLLLALQRHGDPDQPVRVEMRELIALVLSANVQLLPDYHWEPVAGAVRAQLLDQFGFQRRRLGQPALRCEIVAAIQAVPGVAYVDVDAFGGVASRGTLKDRGGPRELPTQAAIAREIIDIAQPGAGAAHKHAAGRGDVPAFAGGRDRHGRLRPAQLAIFLPGVPDTITLNQRS
ncbi:putative baseplate assembly protein [Tahibacter harae]|uniref:Baseplate assembly protein n=1 Tax=Tahibacter harae TaxID=2963937 RepID=A0ABT1QRG8_9GAMM|nr:putative baseplate assembly protein [Tahibacter harae]MCQ4164900.1 putative baseplate assembly protein [Tahibacter harae]